MIRKSYFIKRSLFILLKKFLCTYDYHFDGPRTTDSKIIL